MHYAMAAMMLVATPAMAQQQDRIYDARGNSLGTSTTQGTTTIVRDAQGNVRSTIVRQGDVTTVYDDRGNVTMRARGHRD